MSRPAGEVVIGSRGSALALWQARRVAALLRRSRPDLQVEIRTIQTTGDRMLGRPLASAGGKGLFLKEIEEALLAGEVDCGVHSLKDVPGELPSGCVLAAIPERADPFDVLCLPDGDDPEVDHRTAGALLKEFPEGAVIGTGSLRRRTQLLRLRPDLEVRPVRGNVDTRLEKLDEGVVDALVLAAAGLERLDRSDRAAAPFSVDEMIPAVGQGALAVEAREDDSGTLDLLVEALEDPVARLASRCERGFLRAVAGSCNVPLAAYATAEVDAPEGDARIRLIAMLGDADGEQVGGASEGPASEAESIGVELGKELLEGGGAELLARVDPATYGGGAAGGSARDSRPQASPDS